MAISVNTLVSGKAFSGKAAFAAFLFLLNLVFVADVHAWTVSANFDSLTLGSNGGDQNLGSGDGIYAGNSRTSVVAAYPHSGTKSMQIYLPAGTEDTWQAEFHFPTPITDGGEIWGRFYLYVPTGFNWTANPIAKIFRFPVLDAGGGQQGYVSILETRPSNYSCAASPDNYGYIVGGAELLSSYQFICQTGSTPHYLTTGRWHGLELYVKASSSGSGKFRLWHDGVLIWEKTGLKNIPVGGSINSSSSTQTVGHFMGWWNGGIPVSQNLYFDDLIYTNQTPSQKDAAGNPMIGPTSGVAVLAAPSMLPAK